MRFRKLLAVMVCACVAMGASGASVRKEIEKIYSQFAAYAAAGNLKAMMSFMDPSFHQVDRDGKVMNCEQMQKEMQGMMQSVKDAKLTFVVHQVQTYGNEVSAWVTMDMKWMMKQGDKWSPVSFKGNFVESLRKTERGWKFFHTYEVDKF